MDTMPWLFLFFDFPVIFSLLVRIIIYRTRSGCQPVVFLYSSGIAAQHGPHIVAQSFSPGHMGNHAIIFSNELWLISYLRSWYQCG